MEILNITKKTILKFKYFLPPTLIQWFPDWFPVLPTSFDHKPLKESSRPHAITAHTLFCEDFHYNVLNHLLLPQKESVTVISTGFSVCKWQPLILIMVDRWLFVIQICLSLGSLFWELHHLHASAHPALHSILPFIERSASSTQLYLPGLSTRILFKMLLALAIF